MRRSFRYPVSYLITFVLWSAVSQRPNTSAWGEVFPPASSKSVTDRPATADLHRGTMLLVGAFDQTSSSPSDASARSLIEQARRHLVRLEYQAAADKATQAIQLDPESPKAYAIQGIALLLLNDQAGEAALHRAEELDKQRAISLVQVGLGTLFWKKFKSLEASRPKGSGRPRDREGLADQAKTAFELARKLDPNEVLACNGLGVIYLSQDRYEDAAREFREALQRDPEYAAAYFNLGNVYLEKQQWPKAEDAYRQAVRLQYQSATFHALLAYALRRQGKRIEAQREVDEAKRLGLSRSPFYEEMAPTQ